MKLHPGLLVIPCVLLWQFQVGLSQPAQPAGAIASYNESQQALSARFYDPVIAREHLHLIGELIAKYRLIKDGRWPETFNHVQWTLMKQGNVVSRESFAEAGRKLFNPDVNYSQDVAYAKYGVAPYAIVSRRPNGSTYDTPHFISTRDVLSFTDLYYTPNYRVNTSLRFNPQGGYIVLWDDKSIDAVPYDQVFYTPYLGIANALTIVFPTQAGVSGSQTISYAELRSTLPKTQSILGKPILVNHDDPMPDNGGPEALVSLSRLLNTPNRYGINRQDLWKQFAPLQQEFTLLQIQEGATKIGLSTQLQNISLDELKAKSTPALLFLQDDGRIVTLTAIDDDHAVIIDRGFTRNIERSVLEKRYSGQALVPTKALTQNAAIVADDAVRELKLPSLDAEVPQQFVLRNRGTTPITLQLEYPLLGVTESKLSRDTLAPGETATLDLKVKWRSILQAPTQNVLVSLQTNDPVAPRLQLAILLVPPAKAAQ